jgi:hypothetical protein
LNTNIFEQEHQEVIMSKRNILLAPLIVLAIVALGVRLAPFHSTARISAIQQVTAPVGSLSWYAQTATSTGNNHITVPAKEAIYFTSFASMELVRSNFHIMVVSNSQFANCS